MKKMESPKTVLVKELRMMPVASENETSNR